jgi:hypothetical protein
MDWIYSDETVNELYRKWNKLGWRSTQDIYKGEVDVEELITETTHAARYDGRLLQVLLTWCRDFGDLINNRRLLRFISQADTAVLGAILEITMHYGGYQNFIPVIKQCHPVKPAEVLLRGFEDIDIYMEEQKMYRKQEYKKWGLFCTSIEFYNDAFRTREWVLQQNKLLALRVVFGANMRSEILYCLDTIKEIGIRKLSQSLGYAYSGVYREVELFEKNGLIIEKKGRGRVIKLSDKMKRIIYSAEQIISESA